MLNITTKEREAEVLSSEAPPLSAPPVAGAARRPVRSDFARINPSYAARRIAMAAVALAVLGGALYVAFGLNERNQPQEVPVIKADGDYKEKPEEPGGIDIPHQDVQVYQKLDQQGGGDASQAEHLLPQAEAPQAQLMSSGTPSFSENATIEAAHLPSSSGNAASPEPIHAGDVSSAKVGADAGGSAAGIPAAQSSGTAPGETALVHEAPVPAGGASSVASSAAPVAAVSSPSLPSSSSPPPPPSPALSASAPVPAQTVAVASAPSQVVPMPMPSAPGAGVAPSSASRRAAVVAAAPVAEIPSAPKVKPQPTASQIVASVASPVASPAIGGKKGAVQLASFPDKAVAEQAVGKMQAKYSAYLGGARLRVVEADLGAKGIYYRIQSESLSESQARKICSSLKTLKAGCLFVRP